MAEAMSNQSISIEAACRQELILYSGFRSEGLRLKLSSLASKVLFFIRFDFDDECF